RIGCCGRRRSRRVGGWSDRGRSLWRSHSLGRRWRRGGLRLVLGFLRRLRLLMGGVLIGTARALGFASRIVVNAPDRDGAAIWIDMDAAASIFEGVLGLRGSACQQECGKSQQPRHRDLLSSLIPGSSLTKPLVSGT